MVRVSLVPLFALGCALVAQTPAAGAKRLTLQEAIQTSLVNNLQVDIARQAREVTYAGINISEGVFDWNLSASLSKARLDSGSSSPATKISPLPTDYLATSYNNALVADLSKAFTWGGSLDLNYAPSFAYYKADVVNGVNSSGVVVPNQYTNNPVPYTGTLTATYSQNFLQGFGTEVTTAPLVVAKKNAESADFTFQLAIINLASATEGYYWNLVYAQRNLDSMKISLKEAQQQLRENKIRLEVGTMAPLDVTSAEAQVAQAEQNIIGATAALENAKDTLVRALYPNAERPSSLEAIDAPNLSHIQLTEDAAVKMALDRRVELKSARIGKDIASLQLKVADNKVLPTLSAFASYNGASNNYNAYGPVNTDLAGAKYPGYTLGVKFAMPLQNRAAKGNQSVARANLRSTELSLRDQELSIILQVRTAVRNVEATEKGVKAAEKTRYFQEKTLEAEQKKFENGMSTNFIVLQDMTNLDNARSAEVQAQVNYANAVTALESAVGNLLEARNLKVK